MLLDDGTEATTVERKIPTAEDLGYADDGDVEIHLLASGYDRLRYVDGDAWIEVDEATHVHDVSRMR